MEGDFNIDLSPRSLIHAGRFEDADRLLAQQGWKVRLADGVFAYRSSSGASTVDCTVGRVFDKVLPTELVERLAAFLDEDGPYFVEHKYGPNSPYFSYAHDLNHSEGTLIEQTANLLKNALAPTFPELKSARKIEWWAHSRDHEKGHQIHWDTDAEGSSGIIHNPLCSVVIYLSYGSGGPTVMTEQGLEDSIAKHGWIALPPDEAENVGRVAIFKGKYLHGVVGGHPKYPHRDAKRKTLMIAFWEDVKIRPSLFQTPGACRPLPAGPKWVEQISKPIPNLKVRDNAPVPVPLQFVKPFFVAVNGDKLENMEMPEYDTIFQ